MIDLDIAEKTAAIAAQHLRASGWKLTGDAVPLAVKAIVDSPDNQTALTSAIDVFTRHSRRARQGTVGV